MGKGKCLNAAIFTLLIIKQFKDGAKTTFAIDVALHEVAADNKFRIAPNSSNQSGKFFEGEVLGFVGYDDLVNPACAS